MKTAILIPIFALALEARDLPDVNLKDAQGHTVAKAVLHYDNGLLTWDIKDTTLPQGAYHVKLSKGMNCFQSSEPMEPSDKDLNETMEDRKLLLTFKTEGQNSTPACGKVKKWFSPWRDSRH